MKKLIHYMQEQGMSISWVLIDFCMPSSLAIEMLAPYYHFPLSLVVLAIYLSH